MAERNLSNRVIQQTISYLWERGAGLSSRYVDDMIGDVLLDHGFVEADNPGRYEEAWTALCIAAAEIAPLG